jgi:hypothetical protein
MSSYSKIRQILDVDPAENRCVGFAHSQGRRCGCSLNQSNRITAERILDRMERSQSLSSISSKSLRELASVTLCKHYHNSDLQSRAHHNQVDELCRKWRRTLKEYSRTAEEERVRSRLLKPKMEVAKIRNEAKIRIASIDNTEITTVGYWSCFLPEANSRQAMKHTDPILTGRSSLGWDGERNIINPKAKIDVEDPFVESTISNISKQNPLSLGVSSSRASSIIDSNICVREISHEPTEIATAIEVCSNPMRARQTYVLPSPPTTQLISSARKPDEIQAKSWLNISQPTTPTNGITVHPSFARKIETPLEFDSHQDFTTKSFRFDSPMQLGLSSEAEHSPSTSTTEFNLVQAPLPAVEPALISTPLKPSPKTFVYNSTCQRSETTAIDSEAQYKMTSRTFDSNLPRACSFAITEANFLGIESRVTVHENNDHKEGEAIMPESINDAEDAGVLHAVAAIAAPKTVVKSASVFKRRLTVTETPERPLMPIKTTPAPHKSENLSESTSSDRPQTPTRTPDEDFSFGYAVITSSTCSRTYLPTTCRHGLITPPETPEARASVVPNLRIETNQFAESFGAHDRPPFTIARKPVSSIHTRKPVTQNFQNDTQPSEVVVPEKCGVCGHRNVGEAEVCGRDEESEGEPGRGCLHGLGFRSLRKRFVRKVSMLRTRILAARVKSEEEESKV